MADQGIRQLRSMEPRGSQLDQRPFVEWRNRPLRWIPDVGANTLILDGTAEHVIVHTQPNQVPAFVILPPLRSVDPGVVFRVQNLDNVIGSVLTVAVQCAGDDKINEVYTQWELIQPNECIWLIPQMWGSSGIEGQPSFWSWYACLPSRG